MFLSDLSAPIRAFLDATERRDRAALLACLSDDAVLTDMGKEHRGSEIAEWNDKLYLGSNVRVHPIHVEEREGATVLAVAADGDYRAYGVTEPFQLDWYITLKGNRIATIRMVEVTHDLPRPIAAFIKAVNMYDADGMVATFADGAVANDQMREYVGRDAIRRWLAKEIAGDKVTIYVVEAKTHPGGHVIVARVTGAYDKTGLPDPLELRFYFTLTGDAIAQLIVIPVKRDAA